MWFITKIGKKNITNIGISCHVCTTSSHYNCIKQERVYLDKNKVKWYWDDFG